MQVEGSTADWGYTLRATSTELVSYCTLLEDACLVKPTELKIYSLSVSTLQRAVEDCCACSIA